MTVIVLGATQIMKGFEGSKRGKREWGGRTLASNNVTEEFVCKLRLSRRN